MRLSLYKILPFIFIVLCLLVGNAQASELSLDQIKQTKVKIKQLQQQKNYIAANQLINALIKQDSDNPVFYFDLALNYFFNNQPIQAEKTLLYVLNNKDLSSVPIKVKDNIEIFFGKVKVAANALRNVKNNQAKHGYSASITSSYNDNNNLLTNNEGELEEIEDAYSLYESNGIDPALIGIDLNKEKSIKNSVKLKANYNSKKMTVFGSGLKVNQVAYLNFGNQSNLDEDAKYNMSVNYKIEPKFYTNGSFIKSHTYPLSVNYYSADKVSSLSVSFNPEIDFLKNNRLGYSLNLNTYKQQLYILTLDSDNSSYDIESESGVFNTTLQSVYYQFSKRLKIKFTPSLLTQVSLASMSGDSNYIKTKVYASTNLTITKKMKFLQTFQYSYFDYTQSDNRTEYIVKSKLTYKINTNIDIGSKYQFKMRLSDDKQYEYNQSLFALNLDWSK